MSASDTSATAEVNDKLHQLNVAYVNQEDRLLLRVTTQRGDEYRVWLTRRFTNLLFNVLKTEMDKHGGVVKVGASPQARQMFDAGALNKSFEHEKTLNLPLGEQGFLAYRIKSQNTADGNLVMELLPEKGKGITLNLNKALLYMFYNLLSQGVIKAEWHRQIAMFQDEASHHVH